MAETNVSAVRTRILRRRISAVAVAAELSTAAISASMRSMASRCPPPPIITRVARSATSSTIAASQRSGVSARFGRPPARDSIAGNPDTRVAIAFSASSRDQGMIVSRSRAWLVADARIASAQTRTPVGALSPSSSIRARAVAVTVRASVSISASRRVHSGGVWGASLTASRTSSSAAARRCRVAGRLRRGWSRMPSGSRTSNRASSIPVSASAPSNGRSIMPRQA
jgi:hypothetical protein